MWGTRDKTIEDIVLNKIADIKLFEKLKDEFEELMAAGNEQLAEDLIRRIIGDDDDVFNTLSEVQEWVEEHQDLYEGLVQRAKRIETIAKKVDEKLDAKINELDTKHDADVARLEGMISGLGDEIKSSVDDLNEYIDGVDTKFTDITNELEKGVGDVNKRIDNLKKIYDGYFKDVRNEMETAVNDAKKELTEKHDQDVADVRDELGGAVKDMNNALEGVQGALEEKYDGEVDRLDERIDNLKKLDQSKIDAAKKELNERIDNVVKDTNKNIEDVKDTFETVTGKLNDELDKLEEKHDSDYRNFDNKLDGLSEAYKKADENIRESLNKEIKDRQDADDDIRLHLAGVQTDLEEDIQDTRDEFQGLLDDMETKHDADIKGVQGQLDDAVNKLLDDKNATEIIDSFKEVRDWVETHTSEYETLKDFADTLNNKHKEDIDAIHKELDEDVVHWTHDGERKHIVLNNHGMLEGTATDGAHCNLAMVSKWDVADFGSRKLPINLNGAKDRPTYNDTKDMALMEDIKGVQSELGDAQTALDTAITGVQNEMYEMIEGVQGELKDAVDALNETIEGVQTDLDNGIQGVKEDLANAEDRINTSVKGVQNAIEKTIEGVQSDLDDAIKGVQKETADNLKDAVKDLTDAIKGVQTEAGENLKAGIQGVQGELVDGIQGVQGQIAGVQKDLKDAKDALDGELETLGEELGTAKSELLAGIQNVQDNLDAGIQGVQGELADGIQGVQGQIAGVQSDLKGVQSDLDGVQSNLEGVQSDLTELGEHTDRLVGNLHDHLKKKLVEVKEVIDDVKVKYVPWVENNHGVQSVLLPNHGMIIGTPSYDDSLEVQADGNCNLVMLSKWNVADFGSTKYPINLNGLNPRPTYNDGNEIALLDDVKGVQKELGDAVKDLVAEVGSQAGALNTKIEGTQTYLEGEIKGVQNLLLPKVENNILDINNIKTVVIPGVQSELKDYADQVKRDILGEGVTEAFDTLKEVESWIGTHGHQYSSLLTDLNGIHNTLDGLDGDVKGVQSEMYEKVAGVQTETDDKISNAVSGVEGKISGVQTETDDKINDAVEGLQGELSDGIQGVQSEIADVQADVKKNYVPWEFGESEGGRKFIVLPNYCMLEGTATATPATGGEVVTPGNYNLAMVSKWNVADFGSNKLPINLNGLKPRPTYNDSNEIALLKDVTDAKEELEGTIAGVKTELEGKINGIDGTLTSYVTVETYNAKVKELTDTIEGLESRLAAVEQTLENWAKNLVIAIDVE